MTHPNLAQASGLPTEVWLASRSPRRLQLLESLGIAVKVYLPQNSEEAEALEACIVGELPVNYVQRITKLKLDTALESMAREALHGYVVASDTTVALGSRILGKPQSKQEAINMLRSLSNGVHEVHTGVAVALIDQMGHTEKAYGLHTAQVEFSEIPDCFVEAYVASGDPFDKAGGYGIQGIIAQYVSRINGSHSGIMGLPLYETAQLLRSLREANHSKP